MVSRVGLDLKASMGLMTLCPKKVTTFIGAFEFFASNPDYQDPAANLDGRSCPSSPITIDPALRAPTVENEPEPEPETTSDTAASTSADPIANEGTQLSARAIASASHGGGLLSFALVFTVCGMLQL